MAARAAPGIEPGTSRTRSENHATRPSSQLMLLAPRPRLVLQHQGGGEAPRSCPSSRIAQAPGPCTGPRTWGWAAASVVSRGHGAVIGILAGHGGVIGHVCSASTSLEPGWARLCVLMAQGLLRELNPGPLAPGARIMPLDQAASIEKTTPDPRNSRGDEHFFHGQRGALGAAKN